MLFVLHAQLIHILGITHAMARRITQMSTPCRITAYTSEAPPRSAVIVSHGLIIRLDLYDAAIGYGRVHVKIRASFKERLC